MILRLVWRSLARRPGRSALLLVGYALGVGVTIVLLSIGGALLEQARDRDLVGGGDLTVLPAGLDLETFRTGGVSSLYFTIEQAAFLHRQVLEGPRLEDRVRAAAPWIDDELVYVRPGRRGGGSRVAASAGGQIPSRAAALGVRARLASGSWQDAPADRVWTAPSDSALYASMDAFHLPPEAAGSDSTWAEWHYFNVLLPDDAGWLYLTYMVAGRVPDGRWGGRILATLVEPDGLPPADEAPTVSSAATERSWTRDVRSDDVVFHLDRPDLRMGRGSVRLTPEGRYRLRATLPGGEGGDALDLDLTLRAAGRKYLPALEIAPSDFPSGYTVPILDGRASGRLCVGGDCRTIRDAGAYHDHNWGVWRDVTWDWGQATVGSRSVLYGGVRRSGGAAGSRFLFLADSLGFAGLLPVEEIEVAWRDAGVDLARPPAHLPPEAGAAGRGPIPGRLEVRASSATDTARLQVRVRHARVTEAAGPRGAPGAPRLFYQLHGRALLQARVRGAFVRARGPGFFETWREVLSSPAGGGR